MAPGLQASVDWWTNASLKAAVKRKVGRMVGDLAPVLNEFEAALYDMTNLASNGLDYLMPKIELSLPLYEDGMSFKIRMVRLDTTQIFLETREGDALAEIYLT